MKSCDRDKKRAGKDSRPERLKSSELLERVRESCLLMRQQSKALIAQSRLLRRELQGIQDREWIQ
jgi:hypothetical protein